MANGKEVLVLLSGSGVFDGAEIHESVITLLSLSRRGASWKIAAPDKPQHHVINHHSGEEMDEQRNARVEAARIARGPVLSLDEVKVDDYDALFIPGGFGAAKNLSSLAFDGPSCTIDPDFQSVVKAFHAASKPIGAICIAPAVLVRALGFGNVTIGSDEGTAGAIAAMGGTHSEAAVTEFIADKANKIVTSPAYMCEAPLHEIAEGIEGAVNAVLDLA